MLTIYCDDSGTSPENRVAAAAGYLSTVLQWERFCPEWHRVLDKEGIKIMRRANLENFQGEFTQAKGWEPKRRTRFVKRLQQVIRHRTYSGFGSSVIKADFDEVMPDWVKQLFGGVYGWCAHECIVGMSMWSERHHHNDPIEWIFEAGTEGSGQIGAMFDALYKDPLLREQFRIKLDGWSFKDKSLKPLQSADTLAYELYKHTENRIVDQGKRNIRLSLIDLIRQHEIPYFKFWNKERMEKWLANWDARTRGIGFDWSLNRQN
jgi:hypothetical protein